MKTSEIRDRVFCTLWGGLSTVCCSLLLFMQPIPFSPSFSVKLACFVSVGSEHTTVQATFFTRLTDLILCTILWIQCMIFPGLCSFGRFSCTWGLGFLLILGAHHLNYHIFFKIHMENFRLCTGSGHSVQLLIVQSVKVQVGGRHQIKPNFSYFYSRKFHQHQV